MWTFSALHFLGLCKKINFPSSTSPSHMQVKTYSVSAVSMIPLVGIWKQKQICRDILQYNNYITMSITVSKLYVDAPNHHSSNTAGTTGQEGFISYFNIDYSEMRSNIHKKFSFNSHQKDYLFLLLAILIHVVVSQQAC